MSTRAAILEEIEPVLLGPHDVAVRTRAVAVCITDALAAAGVTFLQPPILLGHAAAGVVEEAGANVSRVRVGDRVVVAGTPECGVCYWCVRGDSAWCEELVGGVFPPRVVARRGDGAEVTTTSVAPNSTANERRSGCGSTATIRVAPATRAAWIIHSPRWPQPTTATDEPGSNGSRGGRSRRAGRRADRWARRRLRVRGRQGRAKRCGRRS